MNRAKCGLSRVVAEDFKGVWVGLLALFVLFLGIERPAIAYSTLTGNGNHLVAPPPPSYTDPFYDNNTWVSSRIADPNTPGALIFGPIPAGMVLKQEWQGNFTHPVGPGIGNTVSGNNTFNFAGLNGDPGSPGTLATHSLLSIGDLDHGSGFESLRLTARDAGANAITTPWLSTMISASGGGSTSAMSYAGWNWDGSSYLLDSAFVPPSPNPTIVMRFTTLGPIHALDVEKNHVNYSVSFGAQIEPIPEPSTALLMGMGLVGIAGVRKRGLRDAGWRADR
ncbi:PEP-CTERM sorting domain-containing protein [Myxococcota bacterium]|nr:PEP-CTERM sorting domain-containing protein [Myxococcota bacterium]